MFLVFWCLLQNSQNSDSVECDRALSRPASAPVQDDSEFAHEHKADKHSSPSIRRSSASTIYCNLQRSSAVTLDRISPVIERGAAAAKHYLFFLCCFLFCYFSLFILCLFLISYFICVLYFCKYFILLS